ncbi:aminotransferase class IV family protein [Spirosoma sp. BT702]|uniref:branched-chain-amino-acid transaminase n=1 Tax=Spirosoma profusum TaxID=2771354 RepID=A0A927ARN8_9BACT|nr:aminotransferase class IV [Spirosoma profusum]MBD2702551.1 aminotransferase class IV family protein [Spirosoma profusum]
MHYGYFNGTIAPTDQLAVGITDLGLLRGYGLFDYFLTYNGKPFQWDWYWERFQNSAMRMHLPLPVTKNETFGIITDLIERSVDAGTSADMAFRFVMTGGYSADSISIEQPNLLILTESIHPVPAIQYEQGIKVILDEYVREMAEVKSTDYKRVILMAEAIRAARASDLLYQKGGEISELSRSNFFIVKGNQIITPDRHILHGITRRTVMQLAQTDFEVIERSVLLSELYDADEAFTTSSTKKVLPIVQIGDLTIADGHVGPTSKFLLQQFDELTRNW